MTRENNVFDFDAFRRASSGRGRSVGSAGPTGSPGSPGDAGSADAAAPTTYDAGELDPKTLADLLLAQAHESGASPLDLVDAIMGLARDRELTGGYEPGGLDDGDLWGLARRTPQLLPRREEPVTYRVRVDLDGAKPPIWRRLDVPSDLTLDRLHHVLQAAMGWTDTHLHAFTMGPDSKDHRTMSFGTPYDEEEGEQEATPEREVRLDEVIGETGHRLFYEYDFGDSWDHTITLEKVLPLGPAGCLAGRRACPPEDCGGIWGYEEMLIVLAGGEQGNGPFETPEDVREWLPLGWTPDAFDRAEADQAVRTIAAGGTPGLPPLDQLNPVLVQLMRRAAGTTSEDTLTYLAIAALAGPDAGPGDAGAADADAADADAVDADADDADADDADAAGWGAAGLGGARPAVADAVIEQAMRPIQIILDVVGTGADLTAAGYLRPAAVEAVYTRLDMAEDWIGKATREDLTPTWEALAALGAFDSWAGRTVTDLGRQLARAALLKA